MQKSLLFVLPLFLVLFIDGMGLGLLIPILNSIIIDPSIAFLSAGLSEGVRDFLYGLTLGIFMVCWFFGAAILGDLSDTTGRKKALLICLLGSFAGYLISALAVIIHSFLLLLLGRVIAGFTAGSQPIAQAAIVDVSTPENKARNIGLILLALSLGFVFGPIIGGFLSDSHLVSWFSFTMPFYFASLVSLFNAIFLWKFFKETFYKQGEVKIKLSKAVSVFVSAFQHKKVWKLAIVFLIMIFGWSNYFSFISMYLYHLYHFQEIENALFLAVMGLGFSIGCGYIVDLCAKRFNLKWSVVTGLFLTALGVFITLMWHSYAMAYVMAIWVGICMAVAYSIILTLFSNQVGDDEQGWVMGVTGAMMALCFGLTALSTGIIAGMGIAVPMILSIGGFALSASLLMFVKIN